jgi:thiamine monophosphate synthase
MCGRSMPMIRLPRLYAIIDSSCFLDADALLAAAQELEAGGCSLLQYRNKSGNARIMLEQGHELVRVRRRDLRRLHCRWSGFFYA